MAQKRKSRKLSDKALRDYYERHSALASDEKVKEEAVSFPRPRRLVALRLEEETLEAVRQIAAQKGLNYSTLMRMWITERVREF